MALSHDSSQLFVAADDGNVTVLDVKDRVRLGFNTPRFQYALVSIRLGFQRCM